MGFQKFNVNYAEERSVSKKLYVNKRHLHTNFNLTEDNGKVSVQYDPDEKKIMINTSPAEDEIKFDNNRDYVKNCLVSKVMPIGSYELEEQNENVYVFKLYHVRVILK